MITTEKKQAIMADLQTKYAGEKRKFTMQLKEVMKSDDFLKNIEE